MSSSSRSFADWPLDGQIGLLVCILAIACLAGGQFLDRPEHHVAVREGRHLRMKPLRSSAAMSIGVLLAAGLFSYGASQAGQCSTMTACENASNRLAGIVLAAVTWVGALWFLGSMYLARYRFNEEELLVESPWKGERRFLWSELIAVEEKQGRPYFRFPTGGVGLPYGRSGGLQMLTAVDAKILRLEEPMLPLHEDEACASLPGKSVVVSILQADGQLQPALVGTAAGIIEKAGRESIVIRFESGNVLVAPGNLRSFVPCDDDPAFAATWYVDDASAAPAM